MFECIYHPICLQPVCSPRTTLKSTNAHRLLCPIHYRCLRSLASLPARILPSRWSMVSHASHCLPLTFTQDDYTGVSIMQHVERLRQVIANPPTDQISLSLHPDIDLEAKNLTTRNKRVVASAEISRAVAPSPAAAPSLLTSDSKIVDEMSLAPLSIDGAPPAPAQLFNVLTVSMLNPPPSNRVLQGLWNFDDV